MTRKKRKEKEKNINDERKNRSHNNRENTFVHKYITSKRIELESRSFFREEVLYL